MTDMTPEQAAQNSGSCWPEREAIWEWIKRHGIFLDYYQEQDLERAVTQYRIAVEKELENTKEELDKVRASMSQRPADGWRAELQRFGLQWNGPKDPVATPMPDGYWTPWHIAHTEITRLRARVEELEGAIDGLLSITNDSQGVAGYHLNGTVAKWDEFEEVDIAARLRDGGGV